MATISNTAIANIALAELGAARIVSLTDGSKNSGLVTGFFEFAKEQALILHPWNFATRRLADVAELTQGPEWGWDHAYAYPPDCLRILVIGKGGVEMDADWAHESAVDGSQIIVTNIDPPIDLAYIYNVTNAQIFSPSFVIAFAKVLKAMLAQPITGKTELRLAAEKEVKEYFAKGISTDGQEGTPIPYGSYELEDVR
jgi:hypothetical protein